MTLTIGKKEFKLNDLKELERELNNAMEFEEISISGHGGTTLLVLLNSRSAFLIYFRFQEGDHGFQSIDLSKDRNQNEIFILSNQQEDLYPQHFLRTRNEGLEAIEYYFKTGHMTPKIDWISGPVGLL